MTTTNVQSLGIWRVTGAMGTDEDFSLPMTFVAADGVTPVPLSGISFTLSVGSVAVLTTAGGGLTISGTSSNILTAYAALPGWVAGVYSLSLIASGASGSSITATEDVFANSALTVGFDAKSPWIIKSLVQPPLVLVSPVSAQVVANTAAIAALQAGGGGGGGGTTLLPTVVSASSYTITAAGWYLVTTAGAQITLPAVTSGVTIIVGDATGLANPAISILGTVNGSSGGALLNEANESITLGAVPALSSWWLQ